MAFPGPFSLIPDFALKNSYLFCVITLELYQKSYIIC
jgi:hypothetical protein